MSEGRPSEASPPSHVLRIEVPLNLVANQAAEEWDIQGAFREAVAMVLAIARVGTLGLLANDVTVTMDEVEDS